MQGMSYRLDIKKGLLVTSNDWTISSNYQSAVDFILFSFFSITLYSVWFIRTGFLLILASRFYLMMCISLFILLLVQSIATGCCFNPFNKSFLVCKERL